MNKELATSALKEVTRKHKATARWLTWCDGLSEAKKAAGLYEVDLHERDYSAWLALSIQVEKIYMAVNKRPVCPSKVHKHQMYDAAYRAASAAGLDVAPGSISNMDGIARVITQVTVALATS